MDKLVQDKMKELLDEKKLKPFTQPKIDLKKFGEDKDLEYVISVTELPKIETKGIENIKFEVKMAKNKVRYILLKHRLRELSS